MNEQANATLIRRMYDAFAKGDVQTILDHLTDDVEWITEGPDVIPYTGRQVGLAQVRGFFDALAETQEDMKLTTDQIVAQGDNVATLGRYSGTIKATGRRFDTPIGHFFTIRNGKVSRFVDLIDTAAMASAYSAATTGVGR